MGGNDQIAYVYLHNGTNFRIEDTLTVFTSNVRVVDVTADGEWLLVVEQNGINRIYRFNSPTNKFQLFQTITINHFASYAGAITDDHEWLVLTKENGFVYIYTFNGTEFVYKENHLFSHYIVPHLSLTNDHLYLAFMIFG